MRAAVSLLVRGFVCWLGLVSFPMAQAAEDYEHFEKKIRPLLSQHCYECHSTQSKTVQAGLRLDTAEGVKRGGDSGPVLVPGQPESSLLIEVVDYEGDIAMPPQGKLTEAQIADLTEWIRAGAPFPPSSTPGAEGAARGGPIDFAQGRTFWSFQPVMVQPLPAVRQASWPRTKLDHFILAALEREGLQPSEPTARDTLIRRLSFALTGLPPTPEEVQAFVQDGSPEAYAALVERYLQSPQYGEKWGRMWLDLVRYTDQTASWLELTDQTFRYRDWVINAFNEDLPFDQFVHQQLATDLMPGASPEDRPALGLLGISPSYWKELLLPPDIIKTIVADEWEERVDVVTRTFLGLTVACARCHDHKYDPVSTADYYALAGVFASIRHTGLPLVAESEYAPVREAKKRVTELEAEVAKLKKVADTPPEKLAELTKQIEQLKQTPHYHAPLVNAVTEESLHVLQRGETPQQGTRLDYQAGPQNLAIHIRGNPNRLGEVVPRRFLTVLDAEQTPFSQGSGRLELAQAITGQASALTARVLVNRIWHAHFGRGLVTTTSDFGRQGTLPSHPELLDDLAARFIANGWSIKELQREIVHSATWQQSSKQDADKMLRDPENRWLARMPRRRLDFEAWRDAMLAASGQLDCRLGGPSIALDDTANRRRSLYGTIHRHEMPMMLQLHDFPDPSQHAPQRFVTTTPLQGLFALNSPLLIGQAQALSQRLDREGLTNDEARLERAYWLLYSRTPSDHERQLGRDFLAAVTSGGADANTAWNQYAHVLLLSNELIFLD